MSHTSRFIPLRCHVGLHTPLEADSWCVPIIPRTVPQQEVEEGAMRTYYPLHEEDELKKLQV